MTPTRRSPTETRLIHATIELLERGGREAVTTRAVSEAAGAQPPTIYRKFGDMEGLLAAVATHGFEEYLASKRNRPRMEDPVDDLRQGWDLHVEFGVTHPAVYSLMYGGSLSDVAAVAEAAAILRGLVERIAEAGRLRVGVELAAQVVHAAGMGVTLSLIRTRPEERDPMLSELTREAVLAALTTCADDVLGPDGARLATRAVALEAALGDAAERMTPAEMGLLAEWLGRLARPSTP